MRTPTISVVTPSFNQGEFIERTVRSVLGQRYPKLQYVMMDGGSTDDTLEVLQPYLRHFHYFHSGRDRGQADAIARGFDQTSGDILAYLNSDDLLAPGTLHFVAEYFDQHPNIDFIYSHRCIIDHDDWVTGHWFLPPHSNYLMRRWDLIPQETCFWRRSLFEAAGNVDSSYRFAMDYDLFVRMMARGKFCRVNRFLGAFRQHSSSKTSQQLETVGADEVRTVRQKYEIREHPKDKFLVDWFWNWVDHASKRFMKSNLALPGCFRGIGYNYNEVWGGFLTPRLAIGPTHNHISYAKSSVPPQIHAGNA
jgi:glycosyltransferase involved in cell wall biosynthesis